MQLEGSKLFGEEVAVEVKHGGVDDGQVVDVGAEGGFDIMSFQTSNFENDEIGGLVEGKSIWLWFQHLYVVEYHCPHLKCDNLLKEIILVGMVSPGSLVCETFLSQHSRLSNSRP